MSVNDFVSVLGTVSLVFAVGALIVLIYFIASRTVRRHAR